MEKQRVVHEVGAEGEKAVNDLSTAIEHDQNWSRVLGRQSWADCDKYTEIILAKWPGKWELLGEGWSVIVVTEEETRWFTVCVFCYQLDFSSLIIILAYEDSH
jgi:hypothetical protein